MPGHCTKIYVFEIGFYCFKLGSRRKRRIDMCNRLPPRSLVEITACFLFQIPEADLSILRNADAAAETFNSHRVEQLRAVFAFVNDGHARA